MLRLEIDYCAIQERMREAGVLPVIIVINLLQVAVVGGALAVVWFKLWKPANNR